MPAAYLDAATRFGRFLGEQGIELVYGGGRVGLMGRLADGALEAGGRVVGVIPSKLQGLEVGHTGVDELFVVDGMPARKAMMAYLGDAYVALPGGYGTWEELLEVTTLGILAYHAKPVGVLNVNGYYDGFLAFIRHAAREGFVRPRHESVLTVAETPEALLDGLRAAAVPDLTGWLVPTP